MDNTYDTTSPRNHRTPPQQHPLSPPTSSTIKIRESSPHGTYLRTYLIPLSSSSPIQTLPPPSTPQTASSASTSLLLRLLTPFLPSNYPHSVTPDYTPYQIYDSLQAFASSIASLLASRAVLTSLGVDSAASSAGSVATYATLLSIAQNSISHFATIFFAHYFALRISAEVKFYRFLADIVNDVAFILDVLSPSLPAYGRIPALCTAAACRAVCGVCGGSSKAILSAHFARAGNIGELNAKDGSQETVVSLVGMWIGGLVVSRVDGGRGTWVWMLGLLGVHLWANWMAVRSVRLKTLNRGRAGMAFWRLLEGSGNVSVDAIGGDEKLFESGDAIVLSGRVLGYCRFAGAGSVLAALERNIPSQEGSEGAGTMFGRLLQIFEKEEYLLWLNHLSRQCFILLKQRATTETQLKAWCHAFTLMHTMRRREEYGETKETILGTLSDSLIENGERWEAVKSRLQDAGWNISGSDLAVSAGNRIDIVVD